MTPHRSAVRLGAAALIYVSYVFGSAGCAPKDDDPRRAVVETYAKSDARTAQSVDASIAATRAALAAIRSPFDREIHPDNPEGRARILTAIDALRAQAASLTRAASSIQIELSDLQGLGD